MGRVYGFDDGHGLSDPKGGICSDHYRDIFSVFASQIALTRNVSFVTDDISLDDHSG